MRRIVRTINIFATSAAATLAGLIPTSCDSREDAPATPQAGSIRVNTMAVPGTRDAEGRVVTDNTFMVLFWTDATHLENPESGSQWPSPYLAGHAPQPVPFYKLSVYDTRYPYPDRSSYLYATGYSPGNVLVPDAIQGYRRIESTVSDQEKGRYDFLGCDLWRDVYRGSQNDPFAQDKNKLYFRHLAAKLVFFADRDRNTMENKQYVRNVRITNLYMSIDGGRTYTGMYTPEAFEWKALESSDFTSAYTAAIDSVKLEPGNTGVTSAPSAGYKAVAAMPFAGADAAFELQRHATDRVPVYGMAIDSCYVCNNIVDGVVQSSATHQIKLKMDITAELSFNPEFPASSSTGSTTDEITYTHTWRDMELEAIYQVDANGNKTAQTVHEFKPGMEYRVYIHFFRKGVNLVAIEQPWNVGGVHYISISGSDKTGN